MDTPTSSGRASAPSASGWPRPRSTRPSVHGRARGVRQAALALPGGRPPARRRRDTDPGCAAPRQRRKPVRRRRPPGPQSVGDGQALFATETAQRAVDVAIQVHGARALEKGHLLEHLYREVRAPRIYEGRPRCSARSSPGSCTRKPDEQGEVAQLHVLSRARGDPRRPAPKSDEHDEILFIVVHQVYELWFKQLIHELRYLQRMLEEGNNARSPPSSAS